MASLMLKDFKLIKKTWIILIILLILPLLNPSMKLLLIIITHLGFVRLTNYTEVKSKMNIFYNLLPIKRSFTIIQKYIFIFLTTLITMSIYALSLVIKPTASNQQMMEYIIFMFWSLLIIQYMYTLFVFWKNFFIADILVYGFTLVTYLIIRFIFDNQVIVSTAWICSHRYFVLLLGLIISLGILFLNILIYDRKDL